MTDENHYAPIDGALLSAALSAAFGCEVHRTVDQDVPTRLVRGLIEHIEEGDLTDDHSVGICMCAEIGVVRELRLWLNERRTCPKCSGEMFVVQYDLDRVDHELDEGWHLVRCPECQGRGDVALEKVAQER